MEVIVETTSGPWGDATATFSIDRSFRYRLTRIWEASAPRVNFLMLNPSTADAFQLDPTNRRCMGFARDWGYGGAEITNIFAYCTTDPRGLKTARDPVGSENDAAILAAAKEADLVIAAWGLHASFLRRGATVRRFLLDAGVRLSVLRLTKEGHPGHPLYLPGDVTPVLWS